MDAINGMPPLAAPDQLFPGSAQGLQTQGNLERVGRAAQEGRTNVKDAAQEFEGYFLSYIMGVMRETVPDGPYDSKAAKAFYSFYDAEIGRLAAKSGGVGLAKSLESSVAPVVPKAQP